MGDDFVSNAFKHYAFLFFLSLAVFGLLSSFHTVNLIASSITETFKSNVFFVVKGRGFPVSDVYANQTKNTSNDITSFYKQKAISMTSEERLKYLTDLEELNQASEFKIRYSYKLKEIRKPLQQTSTKPTTIPPKPNNPEPTRKPFKPRQEKIDSQKHDRKTRYRKYLEIQKNRRKGPDPNSPDYKEAMSNRRNYTFHYPYNSPEFAKDARSNILKITNHGICEEGHCMKFVSNQEIPYDYSTDWQYYPNNTEITMIATATQNRFQFFPSIFERWGGPVCVAIWAKEDELPTILDLVRGFEENPKRTVIIYHVPANHPNYYDFPVNLLRNICIRNIKTSHFMFLDIDMWPTKTLHQHLLQLPDRILQNDKNAIIIPPIFLNSKKIGRKCSSLEECFYLSRSLGPENKTELSKCVESNTCLLVKEGGFAHLFLTQKWMDIKDESVFFTKIMCFPDKLQEPYLVLKYTPSLPLFDERFINYGYNKIQYMEHLRFYLDNLFIMTQDFALDMYHQKSPFARKFKAYINSSDKPEMDTLWRIFRNELRTALQGKRRKLYICGSMSNMYDLRNLNAYF